MRYKCFLLFHVRKRLKLPCTEFAISSRYPSVEELEYAKFELIKYVQFQHFSSLIKLCSSENPTLTRKDCSNSMRKLQPMIVDGVLRVGGRLERAPVQYGNKHPVILPNYSPLTDLFIYRHHLEVGHSGVGHTWTSLRQQYWIIKGSSAVRRVIGNCILCKKRNASVCKQIMADLPECRLQPDSPPFTHVGVDYFGLRDCYARRRFAQIQYIYDQFWCRWIREYLPNLQERQKWFNKRRNIQVDDLVLIVNDSLPRGKWCLGRVTETYSDKKGAVRSALIKTGHTLIKRPISKLCLVLESKNNNHTS